MNVAADYLSWKDFTALLAKLERDEKYMECLMCCFGGVWGLRISDTFSLKWADILEKDFYSIQEQKNKNRRKIAINPDVKNLIQRLHDKMEIKKDRQLIFLNPKTGKAFTTKTALSWLKTLKERYNLEVEQFTTHSLRKTFGRKYIEDNQYSDRAFAILGEIFGHQRPVDTKRYLGLRQDEFNEVYHSFRL